MSQLDHTTVVFFCLLAFVILGPLTICAVFAVSEFFHERRKRKRKHHHGLRHATRR